MGNLSVLVAPYVPIWQENFAKGMMFGAADAVQGTVNTLHKFADGLAIIALAYAIVMFVIGGIQLTTGSEESMRAGKKRIIRAAVGLVVAIAAYALGNLVQNYAKQSFG